MRVVIPLLGLREEIIDNFGALIINLVLKYTFVKTMTVALLLLSLQNLFPKTKHIAIKYYDFRSYVSNEKITVEPIGTSK